MTKVLGKDVRSITAGTGVTKSGADDNPTLTVTNVATADALSTARTIGGVSFDGSANINLPGVNTAGNQNTTGSAATLTTARTIGGVSFDGSANINLPGVNTAGNQNTTGSAATLTTSRSIGGVPFDGSANINLPGVNTSGTQDTSGNAATATALATPRNIGGVSFDGSANITLPGVNTTGTQDTSGNASTATALATARTIGGVSFDGSANINLPGVNATGNQNTTGSAATLTTARTIGGVSFNGSANINLPGVNTAGNQNTSGNAATATTLETARTIGGVSFDGSANINLPGVNTSGTQDTSGNAATATTATTLETARTIGGVSFNGSADIVPNIVTDTTPQLGGNLDVNGNTLTSTSNGNIEVDPNGSGLFKIKGNSTAGSGSITLNCEQNSHGVKIQGPAHSAAASYTLTLPDNDGNADQVIKSDGSGNLAFVDQIKTIQAELTISDAASAGDVIVYESANSRYRTAGESTTSASVTQTSTSIDYLGTTNSSEGLGQAILVPAYSNKILQLTYESSTYYYRWATLAGDGSVTISSTGSMPSNSDQITGGPAFLVASNKIALIGSDGSNTYYNIGTINTSTGAITWGTNATLYSGATSWDSPSSITYDDNDGKWILVGGDNIRALTYNSSNDSFTVGTAATVGGSHTSVAYDPVRDAGAVVYTSGGLNYCKKWTSSNGSITLGSAVAVTNTTLQSSDITGNVNSPAASSNPHIFYIPNRQKFLMIYQITFNDGFNNRTWPTGYNSVTIEANGTLTVENKDTDAGGDLLFLSASIVAGAVDTDTNTLVYLCNGSYNSDRRLTMGRLTMASNGSTTSESHTTLMSHSNTINSGALIYKSAGQLYGFTRYGQSAGGISELDGEFYGIQNTVTQTNIENIVVGIAEESISAGASGTVNLMGGIDRNQSSLTTGVTYYLTSNGTLNSTADSYNVKVGVAVSATEILLEHSTGVGVESVSSGTGLTGGGSLGNVTLSLENTGVTAATYGSATTVPQITVDGQGRVTSASNVTISAGGTSVTVSDTAPSSPSAGDLWWSSSTLAPYIYYADGSSNQWVEFATRAGGLSSIVADTTPQLGGSLDVNGQDIVTTSNGDIDLDPNGSGVVVFKGNATKGAGQFKLNCENNSHGITIKGPPHSAAASYTLTLPNDDGDADQVLKTDGSGVLSWTTQSGGASALNDLSDVSTSGAASGQVLKYNGSSWAPAADNTGGGGGAGTLTAIASGTIANGDLIVINSDGTVSAVGETSTSAGIGSEAVFESASIWYPAATFDSNSNKVVVAYEDIGNSQYGTAVVGTVSGNSISFGTPVVFESAEVSYVTATFDSNSNKVIIGYRDHGNANRGTAIVGTVSGTSISFGSPAVFNTGSTTELASTFDSNENKVVFAYRDGGNSNYGIATVGTVSGTSISFGSEIVYYSGINLKTALCFDSTNNKVIVAYRAHTNSQCQAKVGTVSGTSISFGGSTTFNSNQTIEYTQLVYDSSNDKVVLIYRDDGNSTRGTAVVGTVSGTSISFGSEVIFNTSASSYISAHFDSGSNKVIIAYRDGGNSDYGTAIAGTVSGTSISFGSEVVFNSGHTQAMGSTFDTNLNKSVFAYVDFGNSSYGTGVAGQLASSSSTNLTATNYIGIADAAYSNSATATIQVVGSVDDAQSGLTAGQAYYVQADGSLSTTASSPSVFAGTAVASTKLIVKG